MYSSPSRVVGYLLHVGMLDARSNYYFSFNTTEFNGGNENVFVGGAGDSVRTVVTIVWDLERSSRGPPAQFRRRSQPRSVRVAQPLRDTLRTLF